MSIYDKLKTRRTQAALVSLLAAAPVATALEGCATPNTSLRVGAVTFENPQFETKRMHDVWTGTAYVWGVPSTNSLLCASVPVETDSGELQGGYLVCSDNGDRHNPGYAQATPSMVGKDRHCPEGTYVPGEQLTDEQKDVNWYGLPGAVCEIDRSNLPVIFENEVRNALRDYALASCRAFSPDGSESACPEILFEEEVYHHNPDHTTVKMY